jgi:hypothetical protein
MLKGARIPRYQRAQCYPGIDFKMPRSDFASDRQQSERTAGSAVARIFFVALALRWAHAVALYGVMGTEGLMGGDSYGYLQGAQMLAEKFAAGTLHGWEWLGPNLSWMPLFPWLTALNVLVFGALAPLTTVLCQGVIDAGTCLLVYAMAALIAPRYAFASGILAAFNPTQIVLSGLLYTDTLFLFFVALSLVGAMLYLRETSWRSAIIVAIGLGGGSLTRVFLVLWSPILIVFLFVAVLTAKRFGKHVVLQLAMVGMVTLSSIAPIIARNVTLYGAWALTSQGGTHLLFWVVPLVEEAKTGTPWAIGTKQAANELHQRFPQKDSNPFVQARRHSQFGREKLMQLGPAAIARAWITGAAINLASPAIITVPLVAALPRTGFYDTKGANPVEKIVNFLFRSDNALFAWIVLAGIAGVGVMGVLQLAGLFELMWRPGTVAVLLMFCLWIGFVLIINGPVASPKYRLPIEPVLVLLAGAGFCSLKDRFARTRNKDTVATG